MVQFICLLDEHRRKFSSAAAGHANPLYIILELHHDLPRQDAKADPFKLVIVVAEWVLNMTMEHPINLARR
jgi:hypothetical protein